MQPASVVDVGCGPGTWLAAWREQGVTDIHGVEGSWLDVSTLQIPRENLQVADLEQPLEIGRSFDLAMSLEVAEHLSEQAAPNYVDVLTGLAPVILFSAAIPFQGGTRHVNEQWPEYWEKLFSARGFVPVDCLRTRIWQNQKIAWYYRQNLLLYVKESELGRHPALAEERARGPEHALALVHPERYLALGGPSARRTYESLARSLRTRAPWLADRVSALRRRG
jgi:SAM-dependent methyltransferase